MSDPIDQPPRPRPFRFAAIIFTLCALVTGGALAATFPDQRWWIIGGVILCLLLIVAVLALLNAPNDDTEARARVAGGLFQM